MTIRIQIQWCFIFIPYMDGNRTKSRGRYYFRFCELLFDKTKLQKACHLNIMYIHSIFIKFDFGLTLCLSWCTALVIHSSGENPFKAKNDFHMRVYHSTKIPWFVADFFLPSKLMENVFWRYKGEFDARPEFVGNIVCRTLTISSTYSQ